MAYSRFGPDCDVYVIGTAHEGRECFTCCGCILRDLVWEDSPDAFLGGWLVPRDPETDPGPFYSESRVDTIVHLLEHRVRGHQVPKDVIDALLAEREWGKP